ncbi:MAG: DUF669 domain-containing protein [Candidatus Brocadiales bacterium]
MRRPFKDWPGEEHLGRRVAPPGEYLCRCVSIDDTRETRDGYPLWNLEFVIVEGEYTGVRFWDNLCWTSDDRTWARAKLIATRMGVPKDMGRDLLPADLLEKLVYVTLEVEEFNGVSRNKPTFAGYRKYAPEHPGQEKMSVEGEESAPF